MPSKVQVFSSHLVFVLLLLGSRCYTADYSLLGAASFTLPLLSGAAISNRYTTEPGFPGVGVGVTLGKGARTTLVSDLFVLTRAFKDSVNGDLKSYNLQAILHLDYRWRSGLSLEIGLFGNYLLSGSIVEINYTNIGRFDWGPHAGFSFLFPISANAEGQAGVAFHYGLLDLSRTSGSSFRYGEILVTAGLHFGRTR